MKQIKLKELHLKNFRGQKSLTVKFNPELTKISGDNGTGKSTVFNAFCWLLFGKDILDRKDHEIRPRINGELQRKIDCKVEGVFLIDGETVELTRTLKEKWQKPRGQVEEVFKGNQTETQWNGSPINVSDYQKRVDETFISNSAFKMLTNPLFFAQGIKWTDQRAKLIELAGVPENSEIAEGKKEYKDLLSELESKGFDDFKKEIASQKRKIKDALKNIQPRIDQTVKLTPEERDWASIEAEINNKQSEVDRLESSISDKVEANNQQNEAIQKTQNEIADLKSEQSKLIRGAKDAAENQAYQANKERRNVKATIQEKADEIARIDRSLNSNEIKRYQDSIKKGEAKAQAKRDEWAKENAKEYKGETTCSCCGQELPADKIEEAKAHFDKHKTERLNEINLEGKEIVNKIAALKDELEGLKKNESDKSNEKTSLVKEKKSLEGQLSQTQERTPERVKEEEIEGYNKISNKIKELEDALKDRPRVDTSNLKEKRIMILDEIQTLKSKLADKETIEKHNQEVEAIKAEGKELSQQLADVENKEYTINQFSRERIRQTEDRVNGMFKNVTFQLFDYTQDGNETEVCIPLVAGVPFPVVNTAGQINAGIDIINTLSKFEGVSAPIFIDQAESVNDIKKTDSQIVLLEVTKENELTIK